MTSTDQLTNFQRRLTTARELTDALVLEALELCANQPIASVPKKYVLVDLCHHAAWEQAAMWVIAQSLPTWKLELIIGGNEQRARLTSPHSPPFTVEYGGPRLAQAALQSLTQALIVLTRLGMSNDPR